MRLPVIVPMKTIRSGLERNNKMTIYDELINAVRDGTKFYIDLKGKTMKIGRKVVIDNGIASDNLIGDLPCDPWEMLERLFVEYYNSRPGAWSEKKRSYFAAREASDMDELELAFGTPRLIAQAKLEGYVLCATLSGQLKWNDRFGSWFWVSKTHPELVLLKEWF